MSGRQEIEAILRDWRDAERRLELATARDAEVIKREIAYYRWLYQSLCAAQADAATAGRHEAEEHRGLHLSGPSTSSGAG